MLLIKLHAFVVLINQFIGNEHTKGIFTFDYLFLWLECFGLDVKWKW